MDRCAASPTDLFTLPPQLGMRGHCFKIFHPRSQTDVRRRSFPVRGVRLLNSLPEHVVTEPNYKTFKVLLAEALGDALYDFCLSVYLRFLSITNLSCFVLCLVNCIVARTLVKKHCLCLPPVPIVSNITTLVCILNHAYFRANLCAGALLR